LSSQSEVNRLMAKGVAAARSGQRAQAYNLLLDVVELDQQNEEAWLWLSTVTDSVGDQRICLENVLAINPNNQFARRRLAALADNVAQENVASPPAAVRAQASSPPLTPITLWPVAAFWASTSLFFIGGGIASLSQFAGIVLRARGVIHSLSPVQIAWLPLGLFFIVFGFTGLALAWQLARKRPGGYYGSLLFGLVLVLLGPGASLVLEPPNYAATVCTGLMPAAAVMLTLASMSSFESYARQP